MKSFKEVRENMRGFAIGPMDTMKPQASLGGSQFFPNKKYAVTMPAMSASSVLYAGTYQARTCSSSTSN